MVSSFFSDLINSFIFEKVDKQILFKIPYCLLFALIVILFKAQIIQYSPIIPAQIKYFISLPIFTIILLIVLVLFLIFTYNINSSINNQIDNAFDNIEWDTFQEKFSKIFEGQDSLIRDIKNSFDYCFILKGIIAGFSLTLLFFLMFLYGLYYINLTNEFILIAIIILIIYIFSEVLQHSPLKDLRSNQKETSVFSDMLNLYTFDNTFRDIPVEKIHGRIILHVMARIFSPIILINEPSFMVDKLVIYWNPTIIDIIKNYTIKENPQLNHYFKLSKSNLKNKNKYEHLENTQIIEKFLNEKVGESIKNLFEKSPIVVFPYLLKPSIAGEQEANTEADSQEGKSKQWLVLQVISKEQPEKIIGYVIIHSFRGLPRKIKLKPRRKHVPFTKTEQVQIFHMIFYGKREFMSYLRTQFIINSTTYDSNLLQLEPDE